MCLIIRILCNCSRILHDTADLPRLNFGFAASSSKKLPRVVTAERKLVWERFSSSLLSQLLQLIKFQAFIPPLPMSALRGHVYEL